MKDRRAATGVRREPDVIALNTRTDPDNVRHADVIDLNTGTDSRNVRHADVMDLNSRADASNVRTEAVGEPKRPQSSLSMKSCRQGGLALGDSCSCRWAGDGVRAQGRQVGGLQPFRPGTS